MFKRTVLFKKTRTTVNCKTSFQEEHNTQNFALDFVSRLHNKNRKFLFFSNHFIYLINLILNFFVYVFYFIFF